MIRATLEVKQILDQYGLIMPYMNCQHGLNNPYHLENTLFNHIVLVYDQIEDDSYIDCTIFHDIGKLVIQNELDDGRISFRGHEYASLCMYLDYCCNTDSDNSYIEDLYVILYHTLAHDIKERSYYRFLDDQTYNKLMIFSSYDSHGRISIKPFNKRNVKPLPQREYDRSKKVIFLIGPPGIGKTTYILKNFKDAYIVNRDDIITHIASQMKIDSYKEAYKLVPHDQVNKIFNDVINESFNHDLVVIDMMNMVKKRRRSLVNRYKQRGYKTEAIILATKYSNIIERNKKRSNNEDKDLSSIVSSIISKSTMPLSDEFDNIRIEIV